MMYFCNDSNDLCHTFLTLTCPSAYYNVSQYVNILQYFGCNMSIWQNIILSQLEFTGYRISVSLSDRVIMHVSANKINCSLWFQVPYETLKLQNSNGVVHLSV